MKPMLAATIKDLCDLRFPLLVTPKLDGIRCLKYNGEILTRRWKLVPNVHIRETLSSLPDGTDGELIVTGGFESTQSSVMTRAGTPDFRYHVFDMIGDGQYQNRVERIPSAPYIVPVLPIPVYSLAEFEAAEARYVEQGYEGIMARDATGPYKFGRSTMREHWLLKYKRILDSEATIIGFEEQMQNNNPIVRDIFGRAKRPGGKSLHTPKGTLGSLICLDGAMTVHVSGMDDELKQEIWDNKEMYLGRIITYLYQGIGSQGHPRFPRFKGFRLD